MRLNIAGKKINIFFSVSGLDLQFKDILVK